MSTQTVVAKAAELEIVSRRIFSAPRATLFALFTNPDHLAEWWGPQGFTNAIEEFDLQPGGRWHLTMSAPDGTQIPMTKVFVEIVEPERIVLEHLQEGHWFLMTMHYGDHAQGTELTWRMRFDDREEFARVKPYIIPANEQNFDRLAAHLAQQSGDEA